MPEMRHRHSVRAAPNGMLLVGNRKLQFPGKIPNCAEKLEHKDYITLIACKCVLHCYCIDLNKNTVIDWLNSLKIYRRVVFDQAFAAYVTKH